MSQDYESGAAVAFGLMGMAIEILMKQFDITSEYKEVLHTSGHTTEILKKGELRKFSSGWEARIRLGSKVRLSFHLTSISIDDIDGATERCTALYMIGKKLRTHGFASYAPTFLKAAAKAKTLDHVMVAVNELCSGNTSEMVFF